MAHYYNNVFSYSTRVVVGTQHCYYSCMVKTCAGLVTNCLCFVSKIDSNNIFCAPIKCFYINRFYMLNYNTYLNGVFELQNLLIPSSTTDIPFYILLYYDVVIDIRMLLCIIMWKNDSRLNNNLDTILFEHL